MLSPERWKQVESLFDELLDQPSAQREQWLQDRCGDDQQLRSELLQLLRASNDTSGYLEQPAAVEAAELVADSLSDPLVGTTIGAYRLKSQIGRGGMGVVYDASREDGQYEQDVVIKLLRVGIDDEAGRSRFRRERQILAQLQHENVARLLDGGVAPDGRPYIVMELVDGERIDIWCDERKATVRERVELFLQVVDAVHYAQRNLVVHRDLKPSNVLVTGEGQVKLLDFGIAKMLDEDESAATQHILMTPEYASPEQVRGEPITVASDVYQLGVLLYELLTGFLPYDLKSRSAFDVSRAVCETDPAHPSRAITGQSDPDSGVDAQAVLLSRRTSSASLRRALSGDLDRILLKALQKDPARRYLSPRDFGEDLRRHLDGRPVEARAGDAGYRTRRFLRRNWIPVSAAGTSLILLLGFGFFHTQRVAAERDRAQSEARQKQEVADFLVDLFKASDGTRVDGQTVTAAELLDRALDRVDSDGRTPEAEARMLLAVGKAGIKLGLFESTRPALQRSYEISKEVYGDQSRDLADAVFQLGENYRQNREFTEALPLLAEAVAIYRKHDDTMVLASTLRALAECRRDAGDPAGALLESQEALAILRREAPPSDPSLLRALGTQAFILRALDRFDEAEALYREVIDKQRGLPEPPVEDLSTHLNNLGFLLMHSGRVEEAVPVYQEAYDMRREFSGDDHPMTMYFQDNLVGALVRTERYGDAVVHSVAGIKLKEARFPAGHWRIGSSYHTTGRVLVVAERYDEAATYLSTGTKIWSEGLGPDHAWVSTGEMWLGLARLLAGDRVSYLKARDSHLARMIGSLDNSMVEGAFRLLQKTLMERGFQDLADENEAMRRDRLGATDSQG